MVNKKNLYTVMTLIKESFDYVLTEDYTDYNSDELSLVVNDLALLETKVHVLLRRLDKHDLSH
jgi:hypothetical protein